MTIPRLRIETGGILLIGSCAGGLLLTTTANMNARTSSPSMGTVVESPCYNLTATNRDPSLNALSENPDVDCSGKARYILKVN